MKLLKLARRAPCDRFCMGYFDHAAAEVRLIRARIRELGLESNVEITAEAVSTTTAMARRLKPSTHRRQPATGHAKIPAAISP